MAKVLGMDVVVANRSGKKQGIKGYIIPGTGDANGGKPSTMLPALHPTPS